MQRSARVSRSSHGTQQRGARCPRMWNRGRRCSRAIGDRPSRRFVAPSIRPHGGDRTPLGAVDQPLGAKGGARSVLTAAGGRRDAGIFLIRRLKMRRTILAHVTMGALGAPVSASGASDRACFGQTLKTEVGTADFGRSTRKKRRRRVRSARTSPVPSRTVHEVGYGGRLSSLRREVCDRCRRGRPAGGHRVRAGRGVDSGRRPRLRPYPGRSVT